MKAKVRYDMSNKQSLSFEKCIHFIFHYFKYHLHLFKPSTVLGSGILSTYKIYVMFDCFVTPNINMSYLVGQ